MDNSPIKCVNLHGDMEDKCTDIKLPKSTSKLFSIESLIANSNSNNAVATNCESPPPVHNNNYGPLPPPTTDYPLLLPPGVLSHQPQYGNLYNSSWFGGLFNAAHLISSSNRHGESDSDIGTPSASYKDDNGLINPCDSRAPLMLFNEDLMRREKLAQYFMNSLRNGGGGVGGGNCDKLTEIIFRSSGGYAGFHEGHQRIQQPVGESPSYGYDKVTGEDHTLQQQPPQHLSPSSIIGCLPLMSKQIQGGALDIHQHVLGGDKYDKGVIDTASNDSCSDDLSLTLSPGESNKHRGETIVINLSHFMKNMIEDLKVIFCKAISRTVLAFLI